MRFIFLLILIILMSIAYFFPGTGGFLPVWGQIEAKSTAHEEEGYLSKAIESERKSDLNKAIPPLRIFPLIVRSIISLIFVVGIMFLCVYVLKKFMLSGSLNTRGSLIKVLDIGYLSPRRMIYVVDVAGEILILGVDSNTISFLAKIEDKEKIQEILLKKNLVEENKKQFKRILSKLINEFESNPTSSNKPDSSNSLRKSIEEINSHIKKLKSLSDES